MKLRFFLAMKPPTCTYQEKRHAVKNGSVVSYEPENVKQARAKLRAYLSKHVPDKPFNKAVRFKAVWMWKKAIEQPEPRTSKPDTDNLNKMLKDIMTDLGFWKDDSLVCVEQIEKWNVSKNSPSGIYIEIEEMNV